jgi:hypothetical protein
LKVPYFNQLWEQANQDPKTYLEMVKTLEWSEAICLQL